MSAGSGAIAAAVVRRRTKPLLLVAGLAAIVGVRWAATRLGFDALVVGTAFGLALATLAASPGTLEAARAEVRDRLTARLGRDLAVGVIAGLGLVALAGAGAAIAGAQLVPGLGRPAAPFLPWVAITILVAGAEEAVLRGRLFDAVRAAGGVTVAVAVTTLAFALMHVPLYGWHVVPLDLGVGLVLAGLRLGTGRVAAPAAAHAVADLATWWL